MVRAAAVRLRAHPVKTLSISPDWLDFAKEFEQFPKLWRDDRNDSLDADAPSQPCKRLQLPEDLALNFIAISV